LFSVNSGSTSSVTLDTSNGQLSGSAAVSQAMTFSLQVSSLTAISNSANVQVFDCNAFITFSGLPSDQKVQMDSVFTAIAVSSASSSPDCIIDTSSYSTTSASNAVSISTSGSSSVDTSAAFLSATNTVSVVVGSQTIVSSSYSAEVFDCRLHVSFPNIQAVNTG